jgi:hypothetical protein
MVPEPTATSPSACRARSWSRSAVVLVGLRVLQQDQLRPGQRLADAAAQHLGRVLVRHHRQPGAQVQANDQLALPARQRRLDREPPDA